MPNLTFYDLHPPLANFREDVITGLSATPKAISPKFFYDQHGSRLFDRITELPEYYQTRTEISIIREHGREMASLLGEHSLLLELGSGSSKKIRLLLDALRPAIYMPIDISKEHLRESAQILAKHSPGLEIHAVCADYSNDFELPYYPESMPKAAFFPGSSIGNFEPPLAQALLQRTAKLLGTGGALLIGVDLIKSTEVLNAAYNDSQGVTADFNLNLLTRINRELDADFDLSSFEHHAFYNEKPGRIEMHLRSKIPQSVKVAGESFNFSGNETIHTENSYKYTLEQFQRLAISAGFKSERVWIDAERLFSVHCLRVD